MRNTETTTTYSAGFNTPGYLPETPAYHFDTFDEARHHLVTEMLLHADDIELSQEAADELAQLAEEVNLWLTPQSVTFTLPEELGGLGTAYWVVGLDDDGFTRPSYDTTNIAVCTDCIMLIANGDGDDAHADVMSDQWPNHYFGHGGNSDDDADFSWSPCEGCGSTLGGSRHAAHVWRY